MRVELISVGRELLRGKIADGNAQRVARHLTQKGVMIRRITVVDDTATAVSTALCEALGRDPHFVVLTGGMGPAEDDRTLEGVADALNLPLKLDGPAREIVESCYRRLEEKRVVHKGGLTAAREKLCRIPVGATAVANPLGVAPGVFVRLATGTVVLCLPGMPQEMQAVLEAALPEIRIEFTGEVALREIEAPTADESKLRPLLDRMKDEFPRLWISSRPVGSRTSGRRVLIRIEATGETREAAEATADGAVKRLLALATR